jgi:hypothetical protein
MTNPETHASNRSLRQAGPIGNGEAPGPETKDFPETIVTKPDQNLTIWPADKRLSG